MTLGSGLALTMHLFEYWPFLGSFKWVTARESDFHTECCWLAGPDDLWAKEQRGAVDICFRIRMLPEGVMAKSPISLALGEFCFPPSPQKLAGQAPSGVDAGCPLSCPRFCQMQNFLRPQERDQGCVSVKEKRTSSSRPRYPTYEADLTVGRP